MGRGASLGALEVCKVAQVKEYAAKARAARRQEQRLAPQQFKSHNLVLRKIMQTADSNKLTPIWEGLFRITQEVGKGGYHLEQLRGKKIPRTWNMLNLWLYYS
ncbi:hypothetical protein CR513_19062, partial [Mucuna pruriens]